MDANELNPPITSAANANAADPSVASSLRKQSADGQVAMSSRPLDSRPATLLRAHRPLDFAKLKTRTNGHVKSKALGGRKSNVDSPLSPSADSLDDTDSLVHHVSWRIAVQKKSKMRGSRRFGWGKLLLIVAAIVLVAAAAVLVWAVITGRFPFALWVPQSELDGWPSSEWQSLAGDAGF